MTLTLVMTTGRAQDNAWREKFDGGVMSMMGHEEQYAKDWLESLTDAAKLVLPLLPKHARVSARDFLKVWPSSLMASHGWGPSNDRRTQICSRINTNSHRLHHLQMPQRILGVGLYPLASLMNHSCQPNCGFYNRGSVVVVRTLRGMCLLSSSALQMPHGRHYIRHIHGQSRGAGG